MATLEEELAQVRAAITFELGMIDAGTDIIDINAPPSVLLGLTVEFVNSKLSWSRQRLSQLQAFESFLVASLAARQILFDDNYPTRKVFEITPEVAEDLRLKQEAMKKFADEFTVPILLADKLAIAERVEIAPVIAEAAPVAKGRKR